MSKGQVMWAEEIPVPKTNLRILQEIYVLEQWLRRIALATLMAKAGSRWLDAMPADVLPEARKQVNLLKRRTFLDPENSDNLVWALTLEQLRTVVTAPELSEFCFQLTGLSRRELEAQVAKLREIRNIVAHNRATNSVALENLRLVDERLGEGIRYFKRRLIYPDGMWEGIIVEEGGAGTRPVKRLGRPPRLAIEDFFAASGLAERRWYILAQRGRFYEFGIVAGDPAFRGGPSFVDLGRLLDAFHDIRHAVLAVRLPLPESESYGEELSVLWPEDVTSGELEAIRDVSLATRHDSDVPYAEQDPKFVCDPFFWFEGGWRGAEEARSSISPSMFGLADAPDDGGSDDDADQPND